MVRNGAFRRKLKRSAVSDIMGKKEASQDAAGFYTGGKRRMKITCVDNSHGPRLGLTSAGLIEQDGAYFKDLEGTGQLLPYEDWRLTPRNGRRIWLPGSPWRRSPVL